MEFKKVHHSRPPLRWFANFCGTVGLLISKPYFKWGTMYTAEFDFKEKIDEEDYE